MQPFAGQTLFFFGTLMDSDVLRLVLGREVVPRDRRTARLDGHRRVFVAGRVYPMVIAQVGARVDGVAVGGLDHGDLARLNHYEGWEYRLQTARIRLDGGAIIEAGFYACPAALADRRDWRLAHWQRRHKRLALTRIRQVMATFKRGGQGRIRRPPATPGA